MTLTQQIRNAIDATGTPVWQRLNAIRALVGLPPAKRGRRPGGARPKAARYAANKARYDRLVAEGCCVVCGKNPTEPGQRRCTCCKAKRKPAGA